MNAMGSPQLTVRELAAELSGPTPPQILDVREAHELAMSALPNVVHIPIDQLESRLSELDPNQDWVVLCRSGMRSAHGTQVMLRAGFTKVRNIVGGINAYATEIDRSLTVY